MHTLKLVCIALLLVSGSVKSLFAQSAARSYAGEPDPARQESRAYLFGDWNTAEPLDYALGTLFPTTFESFDPAATPALEICFYSVSNFYVKSAVLAGDRNP